MAISTNPKPKIYRDLYENTAPEVNMFCIFSHDQIDHNSNSVIDQSVRSELTPRNVKTSKYPRTFYR